MHPAQRPTADLLEDCDIRFSRKGGPGGQHRNKVETAVVIHHRPTGVTGDANERRSQKDNRAVAAFRLRVNLALAVRRPLTRAKPSDLWQTRCTRGRVVINPTHDDFPALLAEALDALAACNDDLAEAATFLGCSTSQLVKLLKIEPRAIACLNDRRRERGEHAIR